MHQWSLPESLSNPRASGNGVGLYAAIGVPVLAVVACCFVQVVARVVPPVAVLMAGR